jgi:hypothetical protein
MRVGKKIINLDRHDPGPIPCCWDTCDRWGLDIYTHVFCEHDPREGCEHADRRLLAQAGRVAHLKFAFCSHRHLSYYRNAEGRNALDAIARTGRAHGNLPVGERTRYG